MTKSLLLACGVICAYVPVNPPGRQADVRVETDVKATFLYQFSRYIDWPANTFPPESDSPFKVCVLADLPFVQSLDKTIDGETVKGRPMARSVPETPDAARRCQILYVGRSEFDRAQSLIAAARSGPVLMVSDDPDLLALGGHIVLVRDSNRIRFDINLFAARESKISVRSQLLRVARRVLTTRGR